MKKPLITLLGMGLLILACKNKTASPVENTTDSTNSYLPVTDFIREDIRKVDSFAGGILYKASRNDAKDSFFIQPVRFHELAQAFLSPDLDSAYFGEHFTETSLMDQTTELLQFIYSAKTPDSRVRKVVVYVEPSLATDKISRVYLEKEYKEGDTIVQQKLTWKLRDYFIILTIKEAANGPSSTNIQRVIWDPLQFGEE